MVDKLIGTLESKGYPVFLQGSLLPDQPYPDSFFTYWNDDTTGQSFYDNNENRIDWSYSVNFYSTDPNKVNSMLLEIKPLLKEAGFIVTGAGYSVMSDELTHTGRGVSVRYIQEVNYG